MQVSIAVGRSLLAMGKSLEVKVFKAAWIAAHGC